ncbi:MAG TPA: hypothetical protein DCQ31_07125 [Bacteroidales bacterium]|nr:hypothetical protein [Bacteroidales bacterium]
MSKPDKSSKTGIVKLSGDVSIQTIQKHYAEIVTALQKNQSVRIVGENINAFDLTAVQVLIAAKKQAETEKKQLAFEIKLPSDLHKIMQNAGFEAYFLK